MNLLYHYIGMPREARKSSFWNDWNGPLFLFPLNYDGTSNHAALCFLLGPYGTDDWEGRGRECANVNFIEKI